MGWVIKPVQTAPQTEINLIQQTDTFDIDTTGVLPYPFPKEEAFEYPESKDSSFLFLGNPSNLKKELEFDPVSGEYVFYEKIGKLNYRLPKTMSLQDYIRYDFQNSVRNYWKQRTNQQDMETQGSFIPKLNIGGEAFNRIFGGNTIDVRPQGYVEVSFGYQLNTTENPAIPERLRKTPTFDFDQKIQMNVMGNIGEKMKMRVNYNTEATFDYENKMNIEYSGLEDEILKKIEVGNVSLPLQGSLITGGTNLFGLKTEMQFGRLNLTTIISQNKGETKVVETEGGAQKTTFEFEASNYDANRHFFLAQYFRDQYDESLQNLPIIQSSTTINKIEVWITNKSGNYTESRNILALLDLGEHDSNIFNSVPAFGDAGGQPYPESIYPFNEANGLYSSMIDNYNAIRNVAQITSTMAGVGSGFDGGQDFEKIESARKLNASEYSIHETLGYISLNSSLNADEVLAVAYNYTANGKIYQVGEFSTDGIQAPQTMILKMLKGTNLSPKLPTWDLMMKNIYSLNAYQLTNDDFVLDVLYLNDSTGTNINYLPKSNLEGHILLNVLNVDNLNSQLDPGSDGAYDYIEGVTVNSESGRIIFPVVEPFGSHLRDSIFNSELANKYVYQTLYDSTQTVAEQDAEHNKFILKGSYKGSSSSEISLGTLNVARGSVRVSAGGRELIENIDYTVDYTLGRVKIINQALLESGTPIQISTESEDLFSSQRKTMLGAYANYTFSENFNMGATVLHMSERPLTQKNNYGEDPISNTMLGVDLSYTTQSQLLTTLVDKLPFIQTKEPSSITAEAEFAQLLPGHSKVIDDAGTAYIDDFEATKTSLDLKSRQAWVLASTPQKQTDLFPEGDLNNDLAYGFNRAKLAWYVIDPLFLRNNANTPDHIRNDKNQQSNHLVREVFEREIFPNRQTPTGVPTNIPVLDLAYYPSEKGPYNYDTEANFYSDGVNPEGTLAFPESRWGGIMREIQTPDFEAANIEFIEFWVMDPFVNDTLEQLEGGDLYFNLGDISEDVLKDSRKGFENGLPETELINDVDTTIWGLVSQKQQITEGFVTDNAARPNQDVGFDGLTDDNERTFFDSYLQSLQNILNQDALQKAQEDPSNDNYNYYRDSDYDNDELSILERYKRYNGPDGNSVTSDNSSESYTTSASTMPDVEDINSDNTLNEYERYYQYRVSFRRDDMELGKNYITDIKEASVELENGQIGDVRWFQFKVPVKQPDQAFGSISDFKSIRFLRMFLKEFNHPVVLRFASLDLVRADWRKYTQELDNTSISTAETEFDVSAVNIEENGNREPVNYILPPDIDRVIDPANPQLRELNEQSLVLKAVDLGMEDARAAYKNIYMDFRQYKRLRLEVHAEEIDGFPLQDEELHFFIRLGSDYKFNYYEYEVPLKLTAPDIYNGDIVQDRYEVWPDENRINIPLSIFTDLKQARNADLREANASVRINDAYTLNHTDDFGNQRMVSIKGSPNLGNVEVMMVGIRHNRGTTSDPKSVEVWLNELRLTDFEEDGGWAANARVTARLADLGSIVMAGRTRTAGFGSIDQSVNERAMDDLVEYDISSNLELGKFFKEEAKVRIPMYVGISKSISNPKYNPLDPDILMEDALEMAKTSAEKDSIKKVSQDYVSRKNINFTNVKVDKMNKSGKPRFYDPANFSLTYAYNELKQRNINTEISLEKNYRGNFSYNFNNRPKLVEPFKKAKLLKGNMFRLIKDFNFYPMPTQISFRTDLYRHYKEVQLRNITNPNLIIPRTIEKDFIWNKFFDLRYNLTRTLKLDFSSQSTARIDEPEGRINRNDDDYQMKRDSIITNLLNMGRPVVYHHLFNASYTAPLSKIPFLNWTTLSGRYQAMYDWAAGPITDESIELGNIAENSRVAQLNGQISMLNLYNKVPFLKEVNKKFGRSTRSARSSRSRAKAVRQPTKKADPKYKDVEFKDDNLRFKANTTRAINHKLKTESSIKVIVKNASGKVIQGETRVINENRVSFTSEEDLKGATVLVTGRREIKDDLALKIAQYSVRTLMSVKSISLSYSSSDGTVLPGFMPEPGFLGSGSYNPDPARFGQIASSTAPGIPFLFGWQDKDFARKAAEKGWVSNDTTLNSPFIMNHNETFSVSANIEPLPFLRIDLNASRSYSENRSEFYNYNPETSAFAAQNKTIRGNFTMSVNTWKTAFSKMGEADIQVSDVFQTMMDNRIIIANRLAAGRIPNVAENYNPQENNPETGFPTGYGSTSQQVLIPAFIAAYTGQEASKVSLSPFPSIKHMRPNWRITYDGIVSKIKGLNKVIKTLNFNHSYRSTYNVGSFISNLSYDDSFYGDGFSYVMNELNNDFVNRFDINSVSINEQFSPLINMDVTWVNDLTTRVEIKRSRNLTLNFANNQLTEVLSNEYIFGVGYRFQRMDLIIKTRNSQKAYSNDLNIRADVSFRKNKTLLRKLVEGDDQLTAGQNAVTIKTTADYMLSDRFQLRVFYDKVINKPFTSLAFPTSNTNFGMSFRFTLAQ